MNEVKDYILELKQAWDSCNVDSVSLYIDIDGHTLRLCFADKAMITDIFPAMKHLETKPANQVSLSVYIFDTKSTGTELPYTPWTEKMKRCKEKQLMTNHDDFHMLYNPASKVYSVIDTKEKIAFYHVPHTKEIPYYEKSAPMRMILYWWGIDKGLNLTHAAAVGYNNKAVILAGRGGSGKSTISLASAIKGLDYLGDDYVFISNTPYHRVLSIYNSAKINRDMIISLNLNEEDFENAKQIGTEKGLIYLQDFKKNSLIRESRIKALFIPVVCDNLNVSISRTSPIRVYSEMSSSTIFQTPGSGNKMLSQLKELVSNIKVYKLETSSDLNKTVEAIKTFLKKEESDLK